MPDTKKLPDLITLYIRQCAIGFAASAVFVALLLYLDVARLGYLVTHTEEGWLAVLMLWVFNGIVFAGVQFGIAIMGMARRDDDGPRRSLRDFVAIPVPVREDRPDRRNR